MIWVMKADGSDKRNITKDGLGGRAPDWSPDGSSILHVRFLSEAYPDIFVMDTTGSDPVRLTRNSRFDLDPTWSPDGRQIAWSSRGDGLNHPDSGIWIMNADGTDQRQLTRRKNVDVTFASSPSFSPNGQQIVYGGYNQASDSFTLWIVGSDGSNPHPLTEPEDYP